MAGSLWQSGGAPRRRAASGAASSSRSREEIGHSEVGGLGKRSGTETDANDNLSVSKIRGVSFPLLPATFLVPVLAYEFNVNAKNGHTRTLLQEFIVRWSGPGAL